MLAFLLWLLLLVICWPIALIGLLLYPLVWLILLPFRLLGIAVNGAFELLRAIILLPARVLRGRPGEHACADAPDARRPPEGRASSGARRNQPDQEVIRSQKLFTPSMKVLERGECRLASSPTKVASNCSSSSRWCEVRLTGVSTTTRQ